MMNNSPNNSPQGWSPLDSEGHLQTIYLLGLHLAGLWLPLFASAVWRWNLHGLLLVVAVIMGVFSLLVFVLLRIWLRLLRDWLPNRLLVYVLYVVGAELVGAVFFFMQNGFADWSSFGIDYGIWRGKIMPKHIYYYPVYALAIGAFLIEQFYKPNQPPSEYPDILDDIDPQ